MRRITFLCLVALCCFCMTASAGSTTGKAASTKASSAGQLHFSDAEIESKIKTKLAKSKIGKDGFTFHVKGGVVTWEGSTNVIQHKGGATRMARTAGAAQVVNNIKISDEARQRASGNLHGGVKRAQLKSN